MAGIWSFLEDGILVVTTEKGSKQFCLVWLGTFVAYIVGFLVFRTGLLLLGLCALVAIAVEVVFLAMAFALFDGYLKDAIKKRAFVGGIEDKLGIAFCCLLAAPPVFLWSDDAGGFFAARAGRIEAFLVSLHTVPIRLYSFMEATYQSCRPTGDPFVMFVLGGLLVVMSLILLATTIMSSLCLLSLMAIVGGALGIAGMVFGMAMSGRVAEFSPVARVVGQIGSACLLGLVLYVILAPPVRFATGATLGEFLYWRRGREAQRIFAGEGWVRLRNPALLVIALLLVAIGLLWIFRGRIGW